MSEAPNFDPKNSSHGSGSGPGPLSPSSALSALYTHEYKHNDKDPGINKPLYEPDVTKENHSAKPKSEKKTKDEPRRKLLDNYDFTFQGLYVSGSKYGRKTIGTELGAPGQGGCVAM